MTSQAVKQTIATNILPDSQKVEACPVNRI